MNRKFKTYAVLWFILLAVFNLLCFVTPNEAAGMNKFGGAFWGGYIFISLAFLAQLLCAYNALKTEDKTGLFYNIPVIRISYIGLIVTMAVGSLCMAIPDLPNWVAIVVCGIVLAFTAMAVIKAKAASNVVDRIDHSTKAQTAFIRSLTADAEGLMGRAESEESRNACKKVYEALRYSDPMSSDALAELEEQIEARFKEFSAAVADGGEIGDLAKELVTMIVERNKKCKGLK